MLVLTFNIRIFLQNVGLKETVNTNHMMMASLPQSPLKPLVLCFNPLNLNLKSKNHWKSATKAGSGNIRSSRVGY